jgi:glyoxylase-like metal-dependent hydrolase (beta-lactamase superfamily II)
MPKVFVLIDGYFRNLSKTRCVAGPTITLVADKGKNILVDTGNSIDKDKILKALERHNLRPSDINFVINTHFHSDHTGCNYLFDKARFLTYGVAFWKDIFDRSKKLQKISENIKIISTPGHSEESVSVLVKTDQGIVAIVGDLFWMKNDIKIKLLEEDCSDKKEFYKNRQKILKIADWIVPGHGKKFKVEK